MRNVCTCEIYYNSEQEKNRYYTNKKHLNEKPKNDRQKNTPTHPSYISSYCELILTKCR